MAYYQRWEKDLSGGGAYQTRYWPDSKGDEADVSWIFAPFILLFGSMFKLPVFRNLAGFLIGLPVVLAIGMLLAALAVLFVIIGEMVCCWGDMLKVFGRDMVAFYRWAHERLAGNKKLVCTKNAPMKGMKPVV